MKSYSDVRVVVEFGKKIFKKRYFFENSKSVIDKEYVKSLKLHYLSNDSTMYYYPKPLSKSDYFITYEFLDDFIQLDEYIFKNLNLFKGINFLKLELIFKKLGNSLFEIHKSLILPNFEKLDDNISLGKKVFLYGDLGLSNILIKSEKIILIDSSRNTLNKTIYTYGSIYFDLAYFKFQLFNLYPLKYLFFINTNILNNLFDIFIDSYFVNSDVDFDFKILNLYYEHIKLSYISNLKLDLSIKNLIWRLILKWKK